MKLTIGSPATGDKFYKRPELIGKILCALERDNVAFLGPRRTGKTSCLEEIRANPGEFLPILMDLESQSTVEGWLNEMIKALREAIRKPNGIVEAGGELFTVFLSRLNKISVGGVELDVASGPNGVKWRHSADELLGLLIDCRLPILFLLDEFPIFLTLLAEKVSVAEVKEVLNWFRAARIKLVSTRVRFLVTGSIGLKGVVKRYGVSASVNELDTVDIEPLSDQEALDLLGQLAGGVGVRVSEEQAAYILALLGVNWPFLIQLFVSEIQNANFPDDLDNEKLKALYDTRLVASGRNQYCDTMFDRLKDAFSKSEGQLAREILRCLCREPKGVDRRYFEALHARLVPDPDDRAERIEELEYVMDTLKHDGYLIQELGGSQLTRFHSNILRDYWLRKTS